MPSPPDRSGLISPPASQPGAESPGTEEANPFGSTPPGQLSSIDPSFLRELSAAGERARGSGGQQDGTVQAPGTQQPGNGKLGDPGSSEQASRRPPTLPLEAARAKPLKETPWGEPGGAAGGLGTILIERDIRIEIWADQVLIEDEAPFKITPELSTNKLQFVVAEGMERQVRSWGVAPGGFQWKPQVKVVLHPGGNANLARLKELFEHWQLHWDIQHKLQ
jgi:hypothetical protein